MAEKAGSDKGGISKVQLAIGAASLFLFIVGLKKTFRAYDGAGAPGAPDAPAAKAREEEDGTPSGR